MSNGLLTPFDLSVLLTGHTFFTYYSFVSMQLIFHSCRDLIYFFNVTVMRIFYSALGSLHGTEAKLQLQPS